MCVCACAALQDEDTTISAREQAVGTLMIIGLAIAVPWCALNQSREIQSGSVARFAADIELDLLVWVLGYSVIGRLRPMTWASSLAVASS